MLELLRKFFSPGSTSEQWKLNVHDFTKGFTMAVLGAIVASVGNMIDKEIFTIDWTTIWHGAATGSIAYLAKNLATPKPGA
jgi:hypothetical protein